ncbi:MAG: PRC-barrel domain-containing protein [Methanothrix sp.]|nr:PRC-barrel domain-containing protein [Methanothrix sp.]
MAKMYTRSLAGKEIVTMAGTVLGELENIVLDPETGKLMDLLVKPDSELDPARYRKEGKLILVPFSSVCALKDYIVVDDKRTQR